MRAVNLIPADQRRASGAAGKSGGGVYVVLGVLALLVAFVAALTFTGRQVSDRTAEADRLESQAQVAQAKAGNLASYKEFDEVVKTRSASVRALAATRFDWGASLDQVSRVVPSDVSLTQLAATVTPGVGVGGVVSLRSALTNPAIELVGCAPSQSRVALLMARLRRLEGVQRVSVANSAKTAGASSSSQASKSETASTGSCQTSDRIPQFQMVVFFGTPQAVAATQSGTSGSVKAAIDTINGGTNGTTTTPAPAAPGH
jgi:Tfp pilus assembly protein PilN